jgi:hypothetical protein
MAAAEPGAVESKIKVYGWRSHWYQVPDLPPRSAGVAGPTETNPALASTFWDAALPWEVAARSVRSLCRAAASQPPG